MSRGRSNSKDEKPGPRLPGAPPTLAAGTPKERGRQAAHGTGKLAGMAPRFAFVTIGQTPRTDLVPEILRLLPSAVEEEEIGALDGWTPEAANRHAPTPGEDRLVTRLGDGVQVVLRRDWVQDRLQGILDALDPAPFTAVVLLCTGSFPGLRGPGLFLDAQHLVDFGAAGLCAGARRVGILLPLAEQARGFHLSLPGSAELLFSHASPYEGDRFEEAGGELASADLVVMHCMGYTGAHRERVARASGRPVLLARRLVAMALANLL
jgi:protein AroM